jgi:hypothetical protein
LGGDWRRGRLYDLSRWSGGRRKLSRGLWAGGDVLKLNRACRSAVHFLDLVRLV